MGAIKLRVQELGGSTNKETLADRARRADERQQFLNHTEALKRDTQGVKEVQEEGRSLVAAIQALAEEAARAAPGLGLQWSGQDAAVGIRSPRASAYVHLVIRYTNNLSNSFLSVRQMMGNIILPRGEQAVSGGAAGCQRRTIRTREVTSLGLVLARRRRQALKLYRIG